MPRVDEADRLLSVDDVADWLKIAQSSVYRMVGRDELPHFRIGMCIRFRREDVEKWLMQQIEGDVAADRGTFLQRMQARKPT